MNQMSELKPTGSPPLPASAGSAAAMRAAERILSGVDAGAVRYHGLRADGQWCWQYRSASEIAAIIEEEIGKPPNDRISDPAHKTP